MEANESVNKDVTLSPLMSYTAGQPACHAAGCVAHRAPTMGQGPMSPSKGTVLHWYQISQAAFGLMQDIVGWEDI